MAANIDPIFPLTPYAVFLQGGSGIFTACTTRAPTATASLAAANIIELVPTSTNGRRIDKIAIYASSTSITSATAANLMMIWWWDGTTAYLYDEIPISAVTPSTTVAGYSAAKSYSNLILPASHKLYVATTVTTAAATTAITVQAFGGDY